MPAGYGATEGDKMLKQRLAYTSYAVDMHTLIMECVQEGKDVSNAYIDRAKMIAAMDSDDPEKERKAAELMDELDLLPIRNDFPYEEPSDLDSIRLLRPDEGKNSKFDSYYFDEQKVYDKVYGAWLGRCAGCLLGQPVEGWVKERIDGLLKESGNYPMNYYISSDVPESTRQKYGVRDHVSGEINNTINWINNVKHAPEDDDTNYTILGMKILEEFGLDFTPDDVAESWLVNLPILHVCTAETVAYRNLVNRIWPPYSGSFRNPFREYIGAQIRADFYGYINPGNPERAAEMGWRDACISHTKNGIYGEMFVAAMLAVAGVTNDAEKIIRYGLSQIPVKCRLAEKIHGVLDWKKSGITWEEAIASIHSEYDEKISINLTHTITNAMIVCIGLLYGEMDLGKSICIAVQGAFDTDCNGATVGSIVGLVNGAKALPEKWIKPFNDVLKSGVDGFGMVKISELAYRTVEITRKGYSDG
jgi:ADP-ribosylglycohydrolase